MVRSAQPAPTARTPAELTIHEVTDEPALEVFERTLVDAFPDPSRQPYAWGTVIDGRVLGGPTRFFTAFVAGRPVATAAAHVAAGINVVEMVSDQPAGTRLRIRRGHHLGRHPRRPPGAVHLVGQRPRSTRVRAHGLPPRHPLDHVAPSAVNPLIRGADGERTSVDAASGNVGRSVPIPEATALFDGTVDMAADAPG